MLNGKPILRASRVSLAVAALAPVTNLARACARSPEHDEDERQLAHGRVEQRVDCQIHGDAGPDKGQHLHSALAVVRTPVARSLTITYKKQLPSGN